MAEESVSIRRSAGWGMVAFGITLAAIIGVRLEQAALAVVVGVVCGVVASIPVSFMIVALMRRRDETRERETERTRQRQVGQSPVVVIAPPTAPQLPQQASWSGGYSAPLPAQRQFAVIGEEGEEDAFEYW